MVKATFSLVISFFALLECKLDHDISSSDFAILSQSKHFIDKTLMLNDFLDVDLRDPVVKVVTAPPKFGKSSAIDTIKRFLSIQVDGQGSARFLKENTNYDIFCSKPLNICTLPLDNFGQYPVVHIDYKPLRDVSDLETLRQHLGTVIVKTFKEHDYLKHNSTLFNITTKELFAKYSDVVGIKTLTSSDIQEAFLWLTFLLHKHFDRKSIVLVDEYDSFCDTLLFNNITSVFADKLIHHLANINSRLFKNNPYLKKALLAGVISIKAFKILPDDATEYRFSHKHLFSTHFGFTSEEVDELIQRSVEEHERIKVKKILKHWYGGYLVRRLKIKLYSMHSVVQFLNFKMQPKSYWVRSQTIENLINIGSDTVHLVLDAFPMLISEPYVYCDFSRSLNMTIVNILRSDNFSISLTDDIRNWFYSYLYDLGLLCRSYRYETTEILIGKYDDDGEITLYPLVVPNYETKSEYRACISASHRRLYSRYDDDAEILQDALNMFKPVMNFTEACEVLRRALNTIFHKQERPSSKNDLRNIISYLLSKKWLFGERLLNFLPSKIDESTSSLNVPSTLQTRSDILFYQKLNPLSTAGITTVYTTYVTDTVDISCLNDNNMEVVIENKFQDGHDKFAFQFMDELSKFALIQIIVSYHTNALFKNPYNFTVEDKYKPENVKRRLFIGVAYDRKKGNVTISCYFPASKKEPILLNGIDVLQEYIDAHCNDPR